MWRKKNLIYTTFIFLVVIIFCSPSYAESKKMAFLFYFFDMNEAAFAYHRHCSNNEDYINKNFSKTLDFVANELFHEAKKNMRIKPEYLRTKILERRTQIQYHLDIKNMQDGCYTEDSIRAKEHYEEFSLYKLSDIKKLITKKTEDEQ